MCWRDWRNDRRDCGRSSRDRSAASVCRGFRSSSFRKEVAMNDTNEHIAPVQTWLAMPMETAERQVIERVRRADDVVHVAVMPDVHLAGDVCVGTAMATRRLLYPSAVGGDIGCGMLALAFDAPADLLRDAASAGALLRGLGEQIPAQRRHRSRTLPMP